MTVRGAVIVGVDRTGGGLPMLRGAAADATRVCDWLQKEGFKTVLLTETRDGAPSVGSVAAADVKKAVRSFVDQGTLDQIVVYFAGRGLNIFGSEIWLLSGAPDDPDEAISLPMSIELARNSGIANIVFISDACAPIRPPGRWGLLNGVVIFQSHATSRPFAREGGLSASHSAERRRL